MSTNHKTGKEAADEKIAKEHSQDPRETDPDKPLHAMAPETVDMTKAPQELLKAEQERIRRAQEEKDRQTPESVRKQDEALIRNRTGQAVQR